MKKLIEIFDEYNHLESYKIEGQIKEYLKDNNIIDDSNYCQKRGVLIIEFVQE